VAWAAVRTKGSAYQAMYHRLARRIGSQKALVAVMHHLLLVIYRLLKDGLVYQEQGADYYQGRRFRRARNGVWSVAWRSSAIPQVDPREVA